MGGSYSGVSLYHHFDELSDEYVIGSDAHDVPSDAPDAPVEKWLLFGFGVLLVVVLIILLATICYIKKKKSGADAEGDEKTQN